MRGPGRRLMFLSPGSAPQPLWVKAEVTALALPGPLAAPTLRLCSLLGWVEHSAFHRSPPNTHTHHVWILDSVTL